MERSRLGDVKTNMEDRELRMGVNWQWILKLKGVKQGLFCGVTDS